MTYDSLGESFSHTHGSICQRHHHPDHLHSGVGRPLLPALIDACAAAGYRQVLSGLTDNSSSAYLGPSPVNPDRSLEHCPSLPLARARLNFRRFGSLPRFRRSLAFCTPRCKHVVSVLLQLHRRGDYRRRSGIWFWLHRKRGASRQSGAGLLQKSSRSRKALCTVTHRRRFWSSPSLSPWISSCRGASVGWAKARSSRAVPTRTSTDRVAPTCSHEIILRTGPLGFSYRRPNRLAGRRARHIV
jgi:hypothetical protein